MPPWKKYLLVGSSIGVGFALALSMIAGGYLWYVSRPKAPPPWNTTAIRARFDHFDTEGDNSIVGWYVLQNTSRYDCRLEDSEAYEFVIKLRQPQALFNSYAREYLTIMLPIFIPTKQTAIARIIFRGPYAYTGTKSQDAMEHRKEVKAFVTKEYQNLDGFVMFDKNSRIQINFLREW